MASSAAPADSGATLAPLPAAAPPAPVSTPTADTRLVDAVVAADATRAADEKAGVDHLGAGNTLLAASNLDGATHEYATAQAYAGWRPDVASAMATARAQVDERDRAAKAAATATAQAEEAAQAAAPAPATVGGLPLRLLIPAIGVDAPIEYVGLTPDGAMQAPQGWWDAGWFRYGPVPGSPGNSVIAGHLDSDTGPAVFWHLSNLGPGQRVTVTLTGGRSETFAVMQRASYRYDSAPLGLIFGNADTANLNLITCGGMWNPFQHLYTNRTVVYTRKAA